MKSEPDKSVFAWVSDQASTSLFVTAVTQAEILYGIGLLPNGRRRSKIDAVARAMFAEDFESRILAFGSDAASAYSNIAVTRKQCGRPISHFDAQIAAIARSTGAMLASRNTPDFEDCGVALINPWEV